MPGQGIAAIIDPDGAALELTAANGFRIFAPIKSVAAQTEKQWASNIDSEGEKAAGGKLGNCQITPHLRIEGEDEEAFRESQQLFEQKYNKLDDEGGVLRIVYPDGSFIDWEVRAVTGGERLIDNAFVANLMTEDEVTFICAPFGEEEEELVGEFAFSGEAKRVLECLVEDLGGSAPALGRMVVTSPEADIFDLKWGRESALLSEDPTAKPTYAATALTPLGGAAVTTATVDGKASTPIVQATLSPSPTSILSTQIAGVGQLTHEGVYEVLAWIHMPTTNAAQVALWLEYGVGDLAQRTELEAIYFAADHPREGKVIQVSLGSVFLEAPVNGPHQWEGRIGASSTATGSVLNILDVGLRPLGEGSGELAIEPALRQPTALTVRDSFASSGALNGQGIGAANTFSGPKSAGTGVNVTAGVAAWSNPGNITSSDDSRATVILPSSGNASGYLKATNFGFAIPSGATILGIVPEIERSTGGGDVSDDVVSIVKGGTIQAESRAKFGSRWPSSDAYASYGSATDLWGATWAYTDINASTFGVAIQAFNYDVGPSVEARVDHVRITVYYQDAAGQTWATSGDAVDFSETGGTAQRSEVSDADINTGRYAVAGSTVFTDMVVGVKAKRSAAIVNSSERIRDGALARYVDNNNWLFFGSDLEAPSAPVTDTLRVVKRVAGTVSELATIVIPDSTEYRCVWLHVDRRGRYFCWASLLTSGVPRLMAAGQDNDLATGGALDDGKAGAYDGKTGSKLNTRNLDDFVVWIPPLEAVIYEGLSLELAHDHAEREGLGGGVWSPITVDGDYLQLAPAGMEGRKNRISLIASPNDPDTMGVGFPKKLTVALYATRRHRTVPDAL